MRFVVICLASLLCYWSAWAESVHFGTGAALIQVLLPSDQVALFERIQAKIVKYPHLLKSRSLDLLTSNAPSPVQAAKRALIVKPGQMCRVKFSSAHLADASIQLSLRLRAPLSRVPAKTLPDNAVLVEIPGKRDHLEDLAKGIVAYVADRSELHRTKFYQRSCASAHGKDWFIAVDKSDFSLYLFHNGQLVARRDVATGICGCSPTGQFSIIDKEKNLFQKGKLVEKRLNDELGDFWLGLNVNHHITGVPFGIHGTDQPTSIASESSRGCIRLRNEEFMEFVDRLPIGTQVFIGGED